MKSGYITAEKAFKKLAEMPAREPITDSGWVRRHAELTRREKNQQEAFSKKGSNQGSDAWTTTTAAFLV